MDGRRAVVWAAVSTEAQANRDRASLEDQLAAGREAAEREGYEVVRELVVPGQSRSIVDPAEAKRKIAAYAELERLAEAGSLLRMTACDARLERL